MIGQWKLDRRQSEFRPADLERQTRGDLDPDQHHPGGIQRRRDLERDRQHQRRAPSHRLCSTGALFRDGRSQDLRQLY